jgi:ribosomal protein S18 acetylase RimI-like enzyme
MMRQLNLDHRACIGFCEEQHKTARRNIIWERAASLQGDYRVNVVYSRVKSILIAEYIDILRRSGLAARRPVDDETRIGRMIKNSNLIIVASDAGRILGVSRAITDFAYSCYLSDLAVDKAFQGRGIGKRLVDETRRQAGVESTCLLLSAPGAMGFYEAIGMLRADNAFLYQRDR